MQCGWAGPEFRNEPPLWARDKYLPARYQGLQWNEEYECYDIWDPALGSPLLHKKLKNGYVVRPKNYKPPKSLGKNLETPPPRNSRGNLNFGNAVFGKTPRYIREKSGSPEGANEAETDSSEKFAARVRARKEKAEQFANLRTELAQLEKEFCRLQGAVDGPKGRKRAEVEERLREVEDAIALLEGKRPALRGPL